MGYTQNMISFDKAYWFTHECPLRKLEIPVFPEPESAKSIKKNITYIFNRVF